MPLKNSGYRGFETQSSRKPGGAIIVVGAFLAVLLVNGVFSRVARSGGVSRLFIVPLLLAVVLCAVGAVLGAAKKRKTDGAEWSGFRQKTGEEMHADHYRRTRRERPRGSADPCAYSEHHSWQKSQAYDDPWDF